jgi:hypothetical protein
MKLVTKMRNDYAANWNTIFEHHRGRLRCYAMYLLPCGCSENIVKQVTNEVVSVAVPDEFKPGFLLRMLAKAVIRHLKVCHFVPEPDHTRSPAEFMSRHEDLPAYERMAYFLLHILQYQTRDASLLMGVSDAQVETLLTLAVRRLEQAVDAPPSGVYMLTANAPIGLPGL